MAGVVKKIVGTLGLTEEAIAKFGRALDSTHIDAIEAKVRQGGTLELASLSSIERKALQDVWGGLTDALKADGKKPAEIAQTAINELTREFGGGATGRAHAIEFAKLAVQASDPKLAARPATAQKMVERAEIPHGGERKAARPALNIDAQTRFTNANALITGNAAELQEAVRRGQLFGRDADVLKTIGIIRTELSHRDEALRALNKPPMIAGEATKPADILNKLATGDNVNDIEITRLKAALTDITSGKPSQPPGRMDRALNALSGLRKTGGAAAPPSSIPARPFTQSQIEDIMDGQTANDILAAEARKSLRNKLMLAGGGTILVGALSSPSQDTTPDKLGLNDIPVVSGVYNWAMGVKVPFLMDEDSLGVGFAKRSYNSPAGLMAGVREYTSNGKNPLMASAFDQEAMGEVAIEQLGEAYKTLGHQSAIVAYRMNGQDPSDISYRNDVIRRVASGSSPSYEAKAVELFIKDTSKLEVTPALQIRGTALQYLAGYGSAENKKWADSTISTLALGGEGVSTLDKAIGLAAQAAIQSQTTGQDIKNQQAEINKAILEQATGTGTNTESMVISSNEKYSYWSGRFNDAAIGYTQEFINGKGYPVSQDAADIQRTIKESADAVLSNNPADANGNLPKDFNIILQGELTKRFQAGGLTEVEVNMINDITADPVNNMFDSLNRQKSPTGP